MIGTRAQDQQDAPHPSGLQTQAAGLVEVWADVPGFAGIYKVSNLGRIKSLERKCGAGKRQRTVPERIIAIAPHVREGRIEFASVRLVGEGRKTRQISIARLVLTVFEGEPPSPGAIALQRDGNPMNARIDNLYWGTFADAAAASKDRRERQIAPAAALAPSQAQEKLIKAARQVLRSELGLNVDVSYQGGGWFQVTSPTGDVLQRTRKVQLQRRIAKLAQTEPSGAMA